MKDKKLIYFFLLFWLILNLLQAAFTQLHFDEAYYWFYSTDLSWGYFDHPPFVAWAGKIGDIISHSNLGFRLLFILMGVFSFFGIYHLIDDKNNSKEVILFILSFPLISIHIAGFMALPDLPLCFFFVLYLFAYRSYLKDDNIKNVILFAIVIAAMVYSKYHGFIILLLTIVSNIKLLSKRSYWMVGIIAFILFLPHIYWQYINDFPSFTYHLADRGRGLKAANFFDFIGSQLLLAGPISGILIFYLAVVYRTKDQFEKTLKYIALGFIFFFLLFCFKGRVEAHWTAVSTIALIIIAYRSYQQHIKIKKIMPYLIIPVIVLIFLARILLATDYFIEKTAIRTDFHNWDDWIDEVDSLSNGYPVLFTQNYKNVSRFSFAKNKVNPVVPKYYERFSQVDLNIIDSIYHGKKIFTHNYGEEFQWQSKNKRKFTGQFIESYYSYTGMKASDIKLINKNDSIFVNANIINDTNKDIILNRDSTHYLLARCAFGEKRKSVLLSLLANRYFVDKGETFEINMFLKAYENEEMLNIMFGLASQELRVFRSRPQRIKIE